jgi:hypothetical protein
MQLPPAAAQPQAVLLIKPFALAVHLQSSAFDQKMHRLITSGHFWQDRHAAATAALNLTRIERVYKNSKLRLRDVAKLPNVFHTLSCHDAHAAFAALGAKGVPPMYRSSVHDACALRGFKAALAQLDSAQLRTRLMKAIGSSVPAFWDLDAIWAGWPAAVAEAFSHEPVAPPEFVE